METTEVVAESPQCVSLGETVGYTCAIAIVITCCFIAASLVVKVIRED